MANEYAVNQADLTAVADAIRSKGGTSDALAFPAGFVAAVGAIQAGSGDSSALDDILARTIVNIQSNSTQIGANACRSCVNLVSVNLPLATLIGGSAFQSCSALESVSIPRVTQLNDYAFSGCAALKSVNAPLLKTLNQESFNSCTSIETLILPSAESIGTYAIRGCTALTKLDLHAVKTIYGSAFINCTALETFIIRKTDGLANMYSTNIFNGTPIVSGAGYIYVPASLVDDYKAQTNWAKFADQIRAIEDYPGITGG